MERLEALEVVRPRSLSSKQQDDMGDARQSILLVEDSSDDQELTILALKESGVLNPVIVAHDGPEALDYLFGRGAFAGRDPLDVPAVMLLDLKLPKLNGLEVLKQVRAAESTRLLPVVILTSSIQEDDLVNAYRAGCNSYIRKSMDFEKFRFAVQQAGLYWLVVNEGSPRPRAGTNAPR